MIAVILDGSQEKDQTGLRVRNILTTELDLSGWEVKQFILRDMKIGNCAGDFFCWVRTPGICQLNDDNRAVAAAIATSDLLIYLTPITFGGYSSILKRMVDHQIQNILPFFSRVNSEIHHVKRYKKYPHFLSIGWREGKEVQSEGVFRFLAQRNGINFFAGKTVAGVVLESQSDNEILDSVRCWLTDLHDDHPAQTVKLPGNREIIEQASEIKSALLLVGSPKTDRSTSNALGQYLLQRLSAYPINTMTEYLCAAVRSTEKMESLMQSIDASDLVILSFPTYIDSLPTPVIEALERIAERRKGKERSHRPLFAAIANCGFPEAQHNETALAICQTFAGEAGFKWAGSLAIGGGGMIGNKPLAESGGKTVRLRKSLDLAAEALAHGLSIPEAAKALIAKPFIPNWIYCMFGNMGWRHIAATYKVGKELEKRPYLVAAK